MEKNTKNVDEVLKIAFGNVDAKGKQQTEKATFELNEKNLNELNEKLMS